LNALSIRHESPLLIACEYGSSKLVKRLLELGAHILQRNIYDCNCLEVAINEKNKDVVEYLIDHEQIFQLMRNAQISGHGETDHMDKGDNKKCFTFCSQSTNGRQASTPMRKLIISMPDMAYKVLDKCTTTVGAEGTKLHKTTFDYEFLEDQFAIRAWDKSRK
jgi:Ankyrin repeats (3 copies)